MVSGKAARTKNNRLFAVNYLDREIRKDNASHVRETVQFSRNGNSRMPPSVPELRAGLILPGYPHDCDHYGSRTS